MATNDEDDRLTSRREVVAGLTGGWGSRALASYMNEIVRISML